MQTSECVDSEEEADWHDLQNAQLLSMQNVSNSIQPEAQVADCIARRAQLRQAQAMFRQVVPVGAVSVVDELIAERRREACCD